MYADFLRDRILQLIREKKASKNKMRHDLGYEKDYLDDIFSGKKLPSMAEFFEICKYFQVSPSVFFDENVSMPIKTSEILDGVKRLEKKDVLLIASIVKICELYSEKM